MSGLRASRPTRHLGMKGRRDLPICPIVAAGCNEIVSIKDAKLVEMMPLRRTKILYVVKTKGKRVQKVGS